MKAFKKCGKNRKKCTKKILGEMFICHRSKYSFKETVQKIKENGLEHGWYAPQINNHYETEQIFGIGKPNKSATVSMNLPRYAHQIIKQNRLLACLMPIQIIIYEKDNNVYISWLNIEKVGKMIGNDIARIMNQTAILLMLVHKDIITE